MQRSSIGLNTIGKDLWHIFGGVGSMRKASNYKVKKG